MTNRRQFIQSGLALSVVTSSVLSVLPATVGATEAAFLRLERFVFDNRFADAVEIAQHAEREGIALTETSGDLTDLWDNHLETQWNEEPTPLAGITTRYGLFVLETLAVDHGMRVVYRGEHGVPQNGRIAHVFSGPAQLIARAIPGPGAPVWEPLLGRAMTLCPVGRLSAAKLELTTPANRAATREVPLFSWIIAPRSTVALTV